ncbi:MAG: L-lactate dehydrogenase complex protein LldG [Micromonosporaceae bacterium]|nr:L-lactate dehydrogenase complex protein LldG [Micromonosporaceae bacterium]
MVAADKGGPVTLPSARDEILARVAAALGDHPTVPEVPREYRSHSDHAAGAPALLELFVERLVDYKATVHRTTPARLPAVLASTLEDSGRLLVPPGLAEHLKATMDARTEGTVDARTEGTVDTLTERVVNTLTKGVVAALAGATVDDGLGATELDAFDTVLTTCAAAAAETGTIVLDASPGQGRRAVTLVPDRHVCVVRADQVVHNVPELLARLDPRRPLTFISGPSATSDIELERVEGVHGPRTLVVILVAR